MISSIRIEKPAGGGLAPAVIHFMPCTIHLNGHAKVDSYFVPKKENDAFTATFRGRKLGGIKDPEVGAHHVYLCSRACPEKQPPGGAEIQLSVSAKAESVYVWDHDQIPNACESAILEGLEWAKGSRLIHSQVPPSPDLK